MSLLSHPRLILLMLAILSMSLYFPLNRGHAKYYLETPFDKRIPFLPIFIYPYFSFFLLIVVGLAAIFFTPLAINLYLALIIAVLAGSLIRYFVHNGIHQPQVRSEKKTRKLVHWLYRHDDRAHTFPSTHTLVTVVLCYYLSFAFPPFAILICIVGILIILSTLFIKQHYIIDVIGGLLVAVLAIIAAQHLLWFLY